MCADVTSPDLKIADGSIDLIFSNWLLMYLSDKEVKAVFVLPDSLTLFECSREESVNLLDDDVQVELMAERMLGWVKPGGHIFFRESCFHQSGDSKRKSNPTHYREPRFYTKVQSFDLTLILVRQSNSKTRFGVELSSIYIV